MGTWHLTNGAYYLGLFSPRMPDLNYHNSDVVETMMGYAEFWLEQGVDGFRIDAARYLFESADGNSWDLEETHGFFKTMRSRLSELNPDVLLVAEAWTSRTTVVNYYGEGDEFQLAFDFDLSNAVERALARGSVDRLKSELNRVFQTGGLWWFSATFINNHDFSRAARRYSKPGALKAATAILFTLPGTPFIYYGDEVGITQGSGTGHEAQRTPMAWDDSPGGGFSSGIPWYSPSSGGDVNNVTTQLEDSESLLNLHRQLIQIRKANNSLRTPYVRFVEHINPGLFIFLRYDDLNVLLIAVNLSGELLEPGSVNLLPHNDIVSSGPIELIYGSPSVAEELSDSVEPSVEFSLGGEFVPGEVRIIKLYKNISTKK